MSELSRTGFASDAKETCERVHGIDILDQKSGRVDLDLLCNEVGRALNVTCKCHVLTALFTY